MPELPEVETVRLALDKIINNALVKKVEIYRYDLRWKVKDNLKVNLEKDILKKPFRMGKYILIPTIKNKILLIHLGMSGQIKIQKKNHLKSKHDHIDIVVQTENKLTYSITYNDPRRFGFVDFFNKKDIYHHFLLKNLGIEALSKELTVNKLKPLINNRKKSIKNTLIDQRVIAGIGNIYASEILFLSKVNPLKKAKSLSEPECKKIISNSKKILLHAIDRGGSSIKNFRDSNGLNGNFQKEFNVYQREGEKCKNPRCTGMIKKVFISNRSTFFCDICQN